VSSIFAIARQPSYISRIYYLMKNRAEAANARTGCRSPSRGHELVTVTSMRDATCSSECNVQHDLQASARWTTTARLCRCRAGWLRNPLLTRAGRVLVHQFCKQELRERFGRSIAVPAAPSDVAGGRTAPASICRGILTPKRCRGILTSKRFSVKVT
jgi:hypothetical protein